MGRRVVHLHPSREEVVRVSPVDVALIADPGLALEDLVAALPEPAAAVVAQRREHLQAVVAGYRQARERLRDVGDEDAPLIVGSAMTVLADLVPDRAIVVADAVTSEPALLARLHLDGPGDLYTSGGSGSLGWGMGAALGVAFATPGRRVVSVVGDGVFQFGLPALWTLAGRGLDVTTLVVNNRSYAAVRSALYRRGGESARRDEYPVTDIGGLDIAAVARGFGITAWTADTPGALRTVLGEAFATPGPSLVEALTDPDDIGPVRPVRPPARGTGGDARSSGRGTAAAT
jgi:benzoylformate decarboxylase